MAEWSTRRTRNHAILGSSPPSGLLPDLFSVGPSSSSAALVKSRMGFRQPAGVFISIGMFYAYY